MWLLGIGLGVPGEEYVWKDGGGEEGTEAGAMDGVWMDEAEETEVGMPEL